MKIILRLIIFMSLSSFGHSWTTDGHILVADLAAATLVPAKSRELETIARSLERTFDTDRRLYLLKNFGESSDLAKIAAFPDRIRDVPLGQLFAQWDLQVPAPLMHLAESDTSEWHYKNEAFYTGGGEAPQCDISSEINIATIFPLLLESYESASDNMSKAILLAFIVHMVADAHQPLHGMTGVDNQCEHDLGGNTFCATARGFGDRCNLNLHALWDGAVGLFDRFDTYATLHRNFAGRHAEAGLVAELDIEEWLQESRREGRFIYTMREDRDPDDIYIQDGQHIAFTRLILAADRLGQILTEL